MWRCGVLCVGLRERGSVLPLRTYKFIGRVYLRSGKGVVSSGISPSEGGWWLGVVFRKPLFLSKLLRYLKIKKKGKIV